MNFMLVIFGVTGDLTKKKLIPALYKLQDNRELENFAVVGIGRKALTGNELLNASKEFVKDLQNGPWEKLKKNFYYFRSDFYNEEKLTYLDSFIKNIERRHRLSGNRIFYLATMPEHFEIIAPE